MKIKDLKRNKSLEGIKVKTPKGVVGYWKSQWSKGVWLSETAGGTQMHPQFVDDLSDCKEWEITEDKVNCHIMTDHRSIDNKKDSKYDKIKESIARDIGDK